MNTKEQSLKDALIYTQLDELPKQFRESTGKYWIKALVLVKKLDTTLSYADAVRDADGKVRYVKDFGTMSPIVGLVSIHPYETLDSADLISSFTYEQKKREIIRVLGDDMKDVVENMDSATLNSTIAEIEIEKHKRSSKAAENIENAISENAAELEKKREESPIKRTYRKRNKEEQ